MNCSNPWKCSVCKTSGCFSSSISIDVSFSSIMVHSGSPFNLFNTRSRWLRTCTGANRRVCEGFEVGSVSIVVEATLIWVATSGKSLLVEVWGVLLSLVYLWIGDWTSSNSFFSTPVTLVVLLLIIFFSFPYLFQSPLLSFWRIHSSFIDLYTWCCSPW